MSDLPKSIRINEEGPREGFQIEKGPIPTARKIELIERLSETGLKQIQVVSFVNPKRVPGMADAEDVVRGFKPKPGVKYTALWLNEKGLERARTFDKLTLEGKISIYASEKFSMKNNNRTTAQEFEYSERVLDSYLENGIPVERGSIASAFGCNYQGDIPVSKIMDIVRRIFEMAAAHGVTLKEFSFADTMAWATPLQIKKLLGAFREKYPNIELSLHLHDTRGMGIANAVAGLEMGVTTFDACVAGLGGCPFAAHKGAAGNVCTEDLVFMCNEMGIETGIDLDKIIQCAELAEEIVGHPLPGSVKLGGNLAKLRAAAGGVTDLPLSGVRVLELGHTVMGPSCSLVLADLGADVIKVEPPEGDRTRANVGFGSALFPVFNRNKRSLCIDLKSDAGKTVFRKVVGKADALIENFAPGAMDRLGIGYEALSKVNPRLIYCALKGFLSGPYEKRAALDEIVQFMGGLAYMTGPSGMPLRAGSSVVDIVGGMFGAIGIMAALRERERTGHGQLIQSSLFESTAFLVGQHMGQQALTGKAPPPMPEKASSWAVYDPFTTADGKTVFIGLTSDNHWRAFCKGFGVPELIDDPELATNPMRARARNKIMPVVTQKFSELSFEALVAKLEALNIPFGPLKTPGDLFEDRHLNESGRLLDIVLPTGKHAKIPGLPFEFGGRKSEVLRQPPVKGAHTREVLAEAGFGQEEIEGLVRAGTAVVPD